MENSKLVRPTKKQRQILSFIEEFIAEHGYSPSYREIMAGLNYTSVSTVALHIDNLIARGHLQKRDYSARSLEVVGEAPPETPLKTNKVTPTEEKWLVEKVEYFFHVAESSPKPSEAELDKLYVLVGALRVLDLEGAALSFISRLSALKEK